MRHTSYSALLTVPVKCCDAGLIDASSCSACFAEYSALDGCSGSRTAASAITYGGGGGGEDEGEGEKGEEGGGDIPLLGTLAALVPFLLRLLLVRYGPVLATFSSCVCCTPPPPCDGSDVEVSILLLLYCYCCIVTAVLLLLYCYGCVVTAVLLLLYCYCCIVTAVLLLRCCYCCIVTAVLLLRCCYCGVVTAVLLLLCCYCCVVTAVHCAHTVPTLYTVPTLCPHCTHTVPTLYPHCSPACRNGRDCEGVRRYCNTRTVTLYSTLYSYCNTVLDTVLVL
jgi:hypothetical protein